jgi:hypothetical protein
MKKPARAAGFVWGAEQPYSKKHISAGSWRQIVAESSENPASNVFRHILAIIVKYAVHAADNLPPFISASSRAG